VKQFAVLLMVFIAGALAQDNRPAVLQDIGIDQKLDEQVPLDVTFHDSTGQTVKLGDYFGKRPVILAPVYYECPMLCTLTLNGLVKAAKEMSFDAGQQYDVVAISFNPKETPVLAAGKKATYVREYGHGDEGGAGWHFLTGDEASIKKVMDAIGFRYKWDEQTQQYAHAAGLVILTPKGKVARYFYGVEFPPRDLRLALVEASANKIGSKVDQVLLFCFHYNPTTGKYSLAINRVLQVAGVGTVLALGLLMFVLMRHDQHGKAAER
jgi:protein SCO1/2